MSWKHFFSSIGINGDWAPTRNASLKALLDHSLLPASDANSANERLLAMSPSQWVEREEQLRSWRDNPFARWPDTALTDMLAEGVPEDLRQPLLFIAGAHSSGRARQRVMWEAARFPGRLTLAISLIRCSDWVQEVRFAAQDAAAKLMDLCPIVDTIECWELILRLESRTRISQQWLNESIKAWLEPGPSGPRMKELLASPKGKVRTWAYRYAFDHFPDASDGLWNTAIVDPNPAIALFALRHAQSREQSACSVALMHKGLTVPHPSVRRESLHALSNSGAMPSLELLRTLTCDRSAGMRSLAGYLLRQQFSEDPREQWRRVLASDVDRKELCGALASLADQPQEVDIPLLRRWLEHSSGDVRADVLRGLLKAEAPISDQELAQLMDGSTTAVRRLLVDAVQRGGLTLPLPRIVSLLSVPGCTDMRRQLLCQLLGKLGHWQHLSLLLRMTRDDVGDDWYKQALQGWLDKADWYAPMGTSTRANLLDLVEQRRGDLGEATYTTIHTSIKRH